MGRMNEWTKSPRIRYTEGGSSYYGHVFWDADVWMLPAILPLSPSTGARSPPHPPQTPIQLTTLAIVYGLVC